MATRLRAYLTLAVLLLGAPALTAPSYAQTLPPPTPTQTPVSGEAPQTSAPVIAADLARIKKALSTDVKVTFVDATPRYQVVVVAPFPTFAERFGKVDLMNGPVTGASMSHREFLQMVTPQLLNSSAGITATDTLQFAAVNWLAKAAVKKALSAYAAARAREQQEQLGAIRAQIQRELNALRGGGG
jgi:hypothetical protein